MPIRSAIRRPLIVGSVRSRSRTRSWVVAWPSWAVSWVVALRSWVVAPRSRVTLPRFRVVLPSPALPRRDASVRVHDRLPGWRGAPDPGHERPGGLELRLPQARLHAACDHVEGSGPHLFDVLHEVHRACEQGVAGDGLVGNPQLVQRQRRGQRAGVPDLQAVGEQHDLNAGVARVVPVRHGVDDRLRHDLLRYLIGHRRLHAFAPRAHRQRDLAEHEVHGVVDQLEHRALIHLVGRDRLADPRPVEVGALDRRRDQEPLRPLPEQQHRRIRHPAPVQQVEVLEQRLRRRVLRQRKLPRPSRGADERRHTVAVEVVERRIRARRRVERPPAQQLPAFEVLHQGRVEPGHQIGRGAEPAAHQVGLRPVDQRLHPGMPRFAGRALDEDQPVLAECLRPVELAFRRRHAVGVQRPVLAAEQSDVEIAALDLLQVERFGRRSVAGTSSKQERLEEPPHPRVAPQMGTQRRPLFRELTLLTKRRRGVMPPSLLPLRPAHAVSLVRFAAAQRPQLFLDDRRPLVDEGQQHARRSLRALTTLFPVLERAQRDADASRECRWG